VALIALGMATAAPDVADEYRLNSDVPSSREYSDPAQAALDEALVEAIARADAADHDTLGRLLRSELTSLYYAAHFDEKSASK
jgi:hypothetical protein